MWIIISGLISLIIAVVIGAYRQFCIMMEIKASWNIPRIWRGYPMAHNLSWIVVTGASIWFAFVVATMLRVVVNDFIGKLSFGILLLLRWFVSAKIVQKKANYVFRECKEFEKTDECKKILENFK